MADSIIARMGLDSGPFKRGLQTAGSRLKSWAQNAKVTIGAVARGFVLFTGARGFKAYLDDLDRMGKLSKRLNISTDSLQRIAVAARKSGTELEPVANLLTRLDRRAGEAALGLKETQKAWSQLNIDVAEFRRLSPENKILALAKGFAEADAKGQGTAALMKLLDTEARELIPLLREGEAGIRALFNSVDPVNAAAIKAAEELNDRLEDISQKSKSLGGKVMVGLSMVPEAIRSGGAAASDKEILAARNEAVEQLKEEKKIRGAIMAYLMAEDEDKERMIQERTLEIYTKQRMEKEKVAAATRKALEAAEQAAAADAGADGNDGPLGPGNYKGEGEARWRQEAAAREAEEKANNDRLEGFNEWQKRQLEAHNLQMQNQRDIKAAEESLARVQLETSRELMSDEELIVSLEEERVRLLRQIDGLNGLALLDAQQELTLLDSRIKREKKLTAELDKQKQRDLLNETPQERSARQKAERKERRDDRTIEAQKAQREHDAEANREFSRPLPIFGQPDPRGQTSLDPPPGIADPKSNAANTARNLSPAQTARDGAENGAGGAENGSGLADILRELQDIKKEIQNFDLGASTG